MLCVIVGVWLSVCYVYCCLYVVVFVWVLWCIVCNCLFAMLCMLFVLHLWGVCGQVWCLPICVVVLLVVVYSVFYHVLQLVGVVPVF